MVYIMMSAAVYIFGFGTLESQSIEIAYRALLNENEKMLKSILHAIIIWQTHRYNPFYREKN